MSDRTVVSLLRVPPFPGAKPQSFARSGHGAKSSNRQIDQLIELLSSERVGGTYWGAQPEIPAEPYTLVAVRDRTMRAKLAAELASTKRVLCSDPRLSTDPWHLVGGAETVIVDADDEVALIGAICGRNIHTLGDGRFKLVTSSKQELRAAARKHVADFAYSDPFTGEPIDARRAIELSAFWRRHIDNNRDVAAAFGIARWKRSTVSPLLWGGAETPRFGGRIPLAQTGVVTAVWRSRVRANVLARLEGGAARIAEIEDGFIRSIGLGADCVPPLSIIVDRRGVYFDPQRESDLEAMLQDGDFPRALVERAKVLRGMIVEHGISKYAASKVTTAKRRPDRHQILVAGQVEDDRAVLQGGQGLTHNLELLRRVRARKPDAHIIYKPHPDVEAGHRAGRVSCEQLTGLADEVVRTGAIAQLIDAADEVHVNTSLAGFEALLRGKAVTTYGVPFYAGWGLTTDVGPVPARRTARRTLDELVAATLILYPRYLDPLTGLPCPAEVLISRLSQGHAKAAYGPLVRLRRLQGRLKRQFAISAK